MGVRELVVRGVRELGVSWNSEFGIQAWVGVSVWEGVECRVGRWEWECWESEVGVGVWESKVGVVWECWEFGWE